MKGDPFFFGNSSLIGTESSHVSKIIFTTFAPPKKKIIFTPFFFKSGAIFSLFLGLTPNGPHTTQPFSFWRPSKNEWYEGEGKFTYLGGKGLIFVRLQGLLIFVGTKNIAWYSYTSYHIQIFDVKKVKLISFILFLLWGETYWFHQIFGGSLTLTAKNRQVSEWRRVRRPVLMPRDQTMALGWVESSYGQVFSVRFRNLSFL